MKTRKPKQFTMHTRYYDEEKERKEERRKKLEAEALARGETPKREITFERRINFRQTSETDRHGYKAQLQRSNIRLLVVLVILGGLCYVGFKYLDSI